jgi:hypothetical protein
VVVEEAIVKKAVSYRPLALSRPFANGEFAKAKNKEPFLLSYSRRENSGDYKP